MRTIIIILLAVCFIVPAAAEDIHTVNATIISVEATEFGCFEVEALTENGDVFAYYEEEAVGFEPVVLTLFNDVEVIDVIYVNQINNIQEVETC